MKELMKKCKENIKQCIDSIIAWVTKDKINIFIFTFMLGFITHISMITGIIMSQDGLWNSIQYYKPGEWEISLGRWGILIVERLNNFIAIPSVATITSLLLISCASIFLIDLLEIKNKISKIIIAAIFVVTPTLTITLLYVYTAVAYCFALLSSILCIWLLYKFPYKKLGFIFSTLSFAITIGIYQSYIGVSIGLCVILIIMELIKDEKTLKVILLEILKSFSSIIIGLIIYFAITLLFLHIFNLELVSYKGSENVSLINCILNLKDTVILAYKDFYTFFFLDTNVFNTNYRRDILYGIYFIFLIVAFVINLIENKSSKKDKIIRISFATIIFLLLPVFLNIIDIVLIESNIYALTSFQMILIIPFGIALVENLKNEEFIKIITIITLVVICFTYYIADNVSYMALKLTYNQNYSIVTRMIDRIESLDEYYEGQTVAFLGMMDSDNFERRSTLYTYTVGSISNNPALHGNYSGQAGTWYKFLEVFFGIYYPTPSPEIYCDLVKSEEFQNMNLFPSKDSVKIIDGIVVVKIKDIPAMPY